MLVGIDMLKLQISDFKDEYMTKYFKIIEKAISRIISFKVIHSLRKLIQLF